MPAVLERPNQEYLPAQPTAKSPAAPSKDRQAFDVNLVRERINEANTKFTDPTEARAYVVAGVARDWQGFAWEYGLKNDLRFTAYEHAYFLGENSEAEVQNGSSRWKIVAEEDLNSGRDFLTRLDPVERGGLVYKSFEGLRDAFVQAEPSETLVFCSHKEADFSDYSFAYIGHVEHTDRGKRLKVWDFLNDLNKAEFTQILNQVSGEQLVSSAATSETLLTTFAKTRTLRSNADVWKLLASAKPDGQIFDTPLAKILDSANPEMLAEVKELSYEEAEKIIQEVENGASLPLLQSQIGRRLVEFVMKITGKSYAEARSQSSAGGSCGKVEFEGVDLSVTERSPFTGRWRCKHCHVELKPRQRYCMECKLC